MYKFITAKCSQGQSKKGVENGGIELYKMFGNTNIENNIIEHQLFNTNLGYTELFRHHQKILQENKIPIVFGGDHSIGQITVGSSLTYNNNIKVLWIDAHADINTYESSISKNKHGMPLSSLIGLEDPWISQIKKGILDPKNLIYYGIRDLDDYEKNIVKDFGIKIINNADELDSNYKYHISFDVDALDPIIISSTGTLAENGLKIENIIEVFRTLKNNIVGIDITEYNPQLGDYINSNYQMTQLIKTLCQILNI